MIIDDERYTPFPSSGYLHVHEVQLDNRWAICFLTPEAKQYRDDDSGYWWLDVKVFPWENSTWAEAPDLEGYIKWDGCMEFTTEFHFCGPRDATLFSVLYQQAAKVLISDYLDEKLAHAHPAPVIS